MAARNNLNTTATSIEALGSILAESIDLGLMTNQAHWNLKGPRFVALHEMLDGFRQELDVHVDTIAERIVQIGGQALGTTESVASMSRLPAYPTDLRAEADHLQALLDRYAHVAGKVEEGLEQTDAAGDANTADILTGYSRALDKSIWFLEAHLQT